MCVVSMIGDHYREKWEPQFPQNPGQIYQTLPYNPPSRYEFGELKKEVLEMKELLKRAKKYDEETGQKDCEMEDKVALLKKVAEMVGVSLDDIFQTSTKNST